MKPHRIINPTAITAELERRVLGRPDHLELLHEAAKEAAPLLANRGLMIMNHADNGDAFYVAIHRIAEHIEGDALAAAEATLDRIDATLHGLGGDERLIATEAACARYSPELDAAYYLGLAMGLRFANAVLPQSRT